MNNENSVLPPDFDGVFRFTNFTDVDFKAKWNNIEYTFPSQKTTPMIIPGASPEEVQHIRKKFARELATLVFYKTPKFGDMEDQGKKGTPPVYTDSDLQPFIQRCLEPLPIAQAKVKVLPRDSADNYKKDSKGRNVTKVLEKDESLVGQGSGTLE